MHFSSVIRKRKSAPGAPGAVGQTHFSSNCSKTVCIVTSTRRVYNTLRLAEAIRYRCVSPPPVALPQGESEPQNDLSRQRQTNRGKESLPQSDTRKGAAWASTA